ncbi:MAG: hypothetical protein M1299_02180 [Firmicutes bacterium]|nr:hypothetical protein [Bacillota bacterium]MCL5038634.1 hypothetical protein [Bacillota bacterium]
MTQRRADGDGKEEKLYEAGSCRQQQPCLPRMMVDGEEEKRHEAGNLVL